MYHSTFIDIRPGDEFFAFSDKACACSNNMLNVTNFYIRNLMTGLRKSPSERTENEVRVIETVNGSIPGINAALKEKYDIRVKNIVSCGKYEEEALKERLSSVRCLQFEELTPEKWFPGYNLLDAVFKYTDDKDYRSHHSHVIQHAIQQRCDDWKGYFEGLKSYSSGTEGFTGKPKIPGYKKSGGRSAAVFDRLACGVKHGRLWFPYAAEMVNGKEKRVRRSISLSGIPHVTKESFVEARIVPYYGLYQLQIITDDGIAEEDILPRERDIVSPDGTPAGVMTLDPGLTNFASIADNRGGVPVVIKGGAVKAMNQWYNKRISFLKSEQMKGHDPKAYHPGTTKQMKRISRKRDAFIRDTFYKWAHYICRLACERGISFIIAGYNKWQKQSISLGKKTDQSFVQVPFDRFRKILTVTAVKYRISVLFQEESYTSKACFGSRDLIPVYGKEGPDKPVFTGKRIKRGLYLQDDGKVMNADVNGSVNIGRKYDERIFPKDKDYSYLYGTVESMDYKDILRESRRHHRMIRELYAG